MKKIHISLFLLLFMLNAVGQVTLTYRENGLKPGDSSRTREIAYVDPGIAGENMVWDFSGIRYTGKQVYFGVRLDPEAKQQPGDGRAVILSEDGYDYKYILGESGCTETGYSNSARKMTLGLSDPIARMKYPLVYGQQYTDAFEGVAWYNEASRIDLGGNFTITADAYGTLILPDRILKNTLRVKSEKTGLQIGTCGSNQASVIRYYWYAQGNRYPVMMVSTTENRYGIKDPVVVQTAWVNLDQDQSGQMTSVTDPKAGKGASDNSVVVYPNPFTDHLNYTYLVGQKTPVTVELYDMSGQVNHIIEQKQVQPAGLHTGSVNTLLRGLAPGMYYLRFTFDQQVVVNKIIKL